MGWLRTWPRRTYHAHLGVVGMGKDWGSGGTDCLSMVRERPWGWENLMIWSSVPCYAVCMGRTTLYASACPKGCVSFTLKTNLKWWILGRHCYSHSKGEWVWPKVTLQGLIEGRNKIWVWTPDPALIAHPSVPWPKGHDKAFKYESQVLGSGYVLLFFNLAYCCWFRAALCSDLLFFSLDWRALPHFLVQTSSRGGWNIAPAFRSYLTQVTAPKYESIWVFVF